MKTSKDPKSSTDAYPSFQQLDGRHPWQEAVPEGFVAYRVRRLNHGKVSYFNYDLAKEMGLIGENHPRRLNKNLCETILDTFCLRIINEYDQLHKTRFDKDSLKPNPYMATRYLQMQHNDKTGRTSGDGRAIWNGSLRFNGVTWDIASRGTGVTSLAPGAVEAGVPLRSGNTDHGYGCGMAEIDELFGAAICAEIFHRNDVPTERVLAIIDLGKGMGIGVRAAPNLLRPAHLFMFLKQGRLEPLRRSITYLIARQNANRVWNVKDASGMLHELTRHFARFVARLDRDYIFAWLEWDGDNVLADSGIIDYGSVRQFGMRHDQYRYDDVSRYSTNLNEQRMKARGLVQTYAQLVDFAVTGVKKPWKDFASADCLNEFDVEFHRASLEQLLFQMGFDQPARRLLLNKHARDVETFFAIHSYFERVKTARKMRKVADGIHRPAIFNMRQALSKMAAHLAGAPGTLVEGREFLRWILSETQSVRRDGRFSDRLRYRALIWQECYLRLVENVTTPINRTRFIRGLTIRSEQINRETRMTGNALIHIVDRLLKHRRGGLSDPEIQQAIERLIHEQTLNPDHRSSKRAAPESIMRQFLTVLHGFRDDI